jgi:hypothetical protein
MTTSADMGSIKDARLSSEFLSEAQFDRRKVRLVINRATRADSVSDAELSKAVGHDVFWSLPHDREVPVSTQQGIPVLLAKPKSTMAKGIDRLAMHLSGNATTKAQHPRGLMRTLLRRGHEESRASALPVGPQFSGLNLRTRRPTDILEPRLVALSSGRHAVRGIAADDGTTPVFRIVPERVARLFEQA